MKPSPKISIVTINYNDLAGLKKTMQSVFDQRFSGIEYIVIDGGSTDGSADFIQSKGDCLDYWVSQKDEGIYDGMNKGIAQAHGEWLVFLNSGDFFPDEDVLKDVMASDFVELADVIYGNSKKLQGDGTHTFRRADRSLDQLWKGPFFRHGAMLVKTQLMRDRNFVVSTKLKVAADFDFIYHLYVQGKTFKHLDRLLLCYEDGGISDSRIRNLKDNYAIARTYHRYSWRVHKYFVQAIVQYSIRNTWPMKLFRGFRQAKMRLFRHYLPNYWINSIPFYAIRHWYYRRVCRVKLAPGASVHLDCFLLRAENIVIGENTVINRKCTLDGRGKLVIGSNVSISPEVQLLTADHDPQSLDFGYRLRRVELEDYAWIGVRAVVLPGVTIGKGAVVAAGAVVHKDVPPYTIVGGIPAKPIGVRQKELRYNPKWMPWFD